jgi:hypothetical protein
MPSSNKKELLLTLTKVNLVQALGMAPACLLQALTNEVFLVIDIG